MRSLHRHRNGNRNFLKKISAADFQNSEWKLLKNENRKMRVENSEPRDDGLFKSIFQSD